MFMWIFMTLATVWAEPSNFAGSWSGQGTYILDGQMTNCSRMFLQFSAQGDQFVFESGERVCEKHSEKFYRVAMTLKDGVIYFGTTPAGSYSGNHLEAHFRQPDGDTFRNWRMSMRREGDTLVYEESRTMDGKETPLISFAGLLQRQN